MQKSLLSALALVFLATPLVTSVEASAQNRSSEARQELREDRRELREDRREVRQDRREIRQDRRQAKPAWLKRGGRYNNGGRDVSDYRRYGLRAPARGQRWVRYNNDYILVSIGNGLIASIVVGK